MMKAAFHYRALSNWTPASAGEVDLFERDRHRLIHSQKATPLGAAPDYDRRIVERQIARRDRLEVNRSVIIFVSNAEGRIPPAFAANTVVPLWASTSQPHIE